MPLAAAEIAALYEEARRRRAEGNPTGAFARYRRVLEATEARGDAPARAALLEELGDMYREACDPLEARRHYEAAVAGWQALGERSRAAETLLRLGQVELLAGDLEAAEARFAASRAEAEAAGDPVAATRARAEAANVAWHRRRDAEGAAELLAVWRVLRASAPAEAEAVLAHFRRHRERLGSARFRLLLRAAGATDAELSEVLSAP